jgi:hypothetical protein
LLLAQAASMAMATALKNKEMGFFMEVFFQYR